MTVAITISASTAHSVEKAMTRKVSDRNSATPREGDVLTWRSGVSVTRPSSLRRPHAVPHAAHRLDHVDAHLLAQASDKHLDRIGIAVEILVVEMLDQFRARDHLAHMVHEISKQPELMGGELQRYAVEAGLGGLGVEPQLSTGQLGRGMARSTAD